MKEIILQNQPTNDTCVSACLAMILNIPVEDVIKEFHHLYCNDELMPQEYLQQKGIETKVHLAIMKDLNPVGLHLVSVPSLNIEARFHQIIWYRPDDKNGPYIYDPNCGKDGKRYYVNKYPEDLLENEVNILGRIFDLEVLDFKS